MSGTAINFQKRHMPFELPLEDKRRESEMIPCISLYQPWASWIAWRWKTIETRPHARFAGLVGRRVAIHAAKKFDDDAVRVAQQFLSQAQLWRDKIAFPRRAIICTAFVEDHRRLTPADAPLALIECDTPRFGLVLRDVCALAAPVPYRGSQGIFAVPRDLIAAAL